MTVIPLLDKYLSNILRGCKTSTIRRGHRNYQIGPCTLRTKTQDVPAKIERVRYLQLHELNEQDAQHDGFQSLHELFEALAKIYPDLKFDDEMTIIDFTLEVPYD